MVIGTAPIFFLVWFELKPGSLTTCPGRQVSLFSFCWLWWSVVLGNEIADFMLDRGADIATGGLDGFDQTIAIGRNEIGGLLPIQCYRREHVHRLDHVIVRGVEVLDRGVHFRPPRKRRLTISV